MREALTQAQLIEALRSATLKKIAPGDEEVQRYYRNNQDKFTTPEKLRVSTILLKVDPSSTAETWNAARKEALEILQQLRAGRDFSQLATIKSGHESAENGGDMGYIHRGMLAEEAQKAIDQLKPGELSKPVGCSRVWRYPHRRARAAKAQQLAESGTGTRTTETRNGR